MEYLAVLLAGLATGLLAANTLWKWKIADKARTGQRLECDGELFIIAKDCR